MSPAERDRHVPPVSGSGGVGRHLTPVSGSGPLSGLDAATRAARQGELTGSASDYLRLATPVREADSGDPISGSGAHGARFFGRF
jgi:hypothetical protein